MSEFGLIATGFRRKTLAEIKAEMIDEIKSTFGSQMNVTNEAVLGQLIGIFSERHSLSWELTEQVFYSQYPDTASDLALDNANAINSVTRLAAVQSIVDIALKGTPTTLIPAGTQFSVSGNSAAQFQTDADVTLIAGTDEVQDITFSDIPDEGSFILDYEDEQTATISFSDNAAAIQTALNDLSGLSAVTVAGTFAGGFTVNYAGADGKQGQSLLLAPVADNLLKSSGAATIITVVETTPGVYQGQVDGTATEFGTVVANRKTMTVIDTPIAGLDSVFNIADAAEGRLIESDAEYRLRRSTDLVTANAGSTEAIRSEILAINKSGDTFIVEAVTVFENVTLVTDGAGRPGKSFEAVVRQTNGTITRDDEIAQAIFGSKPAGIQAFGNDVTKTILDSEGIAHTIEFSRPTVQTVYIILTLTVDSKYPLDGDTQVKNALVAHGATLQMGEDIIVHPKLDSVIDTAPGITDVTIAIGLAPAPTLDDNIVIAANELSSWLAANMTVNS